MFAITPFQNGVHGTVGIHMTGPRTIPQLTHRVIDPRGINFFVRPRFIIIGMTTRAIGLIGAKGPRDRLAVGFVTTQAGHTPLMIPRVIGRGVPEIDGRKIDGVMALVTLHRGDKMISRFAFSRCSVVAGTA